MHERTADFLVSMTAKVKSNLLTLTEHHNSDIANLLDQLAEEEIKFSLVQAKLSSVLTTVDEYRSENALRTSELIVHCEGDLQSFYKGREGQEVPR